MSSPAFATVCSCLVLLGAWKPSLALMEPFFSHMASCVGEPITAVNVPQRDQAALATWNNLFRQGSDIKGGGSGTFAQVYHKSKGVAMSALVLRRRWNRCLMMACVPNTVQQTISCQSLYFSYNPHKHACLPQKGFCHQAMNHFASLDDCKLACAGPAETGRAAIPQPQDTEIRLSILRKKNGVSVTLVNSTLKVPPKKSLFFVGYLLPDPYAPLKGTVKSNTQSQGPVVKAPSNKPQEQPNQQLVRNRQTQISHDAIAQASRPPLGPAETAAQFPAGAQLGPRPVDGKQRETGTPSQKPQGGGLPMNGPPPGLFAYAAPPTDRPRLPNSEQLQVAKPSPLQALAEGPNNGGFPRALPVSPAAPGARQQEEGTPSAQPPSHGNDVLAGQLTPLPPGVLGAPMPPIEGHLAMPASIPGVTSEVHAPPNQLPEAPVQASTPNASKKEETAGANAPLSPPPSVPSAEYSGEAAHLDSPAGQDVSSSSQVDSSASTAIQGAEQHAALTQPSQPDVAKSRKARSAPPSEDKLAGRVLREQPGWAMVPLARNAITRWDATIQPPPRVEPVVEEKVSLERAPHTGFGTRFAMPRNIAEPLPAANSRRQRRGGRRAERWAHRRGPGLPSSISL